MAATFNPLDNGRWDPNMLAHQLDAFAVTIVLGEGPRAVLSIKDAAGKRFDFTMAAGDAAEVGDMLSGIAKVLADNPRLEAEIRRLEDDAIIPYGPH
ncbi:hypothetical protein [Devosia sp. Root635]|uniref:hypothetical protein n=1 Tax=Devosia sp. Root635 TaxID=1736575 RepID=UPI000A43BBEE|nr:hypothetical protein [Devosia sp. Root635]